MDFSQILNRAKNIILNPTREWQAIKQEAKPSKDILVNYVIPFIVLMGVCVFLGRLIFHMRFFSFSYALLSALIVMIVALASVYIAAWVINELASSFGSQKNFDAAFRLVVYSFTAYFVASAAAGLLSIPVISTLISLCGLYSFYIMYTGLAPLMGTPEDKKIGYLIVSVLVSLVCYVVLFAILGMILFGSGAGLSYIR